MKKIRVWPWASVCCRTECGVPGRVPAPQPHWGYGMPSAGGWEEHGGVVSLHIWLTSLCLEKKKKEYFVLREM